MGPRKHPKPRCLRCGVDAAIHMRHHKLALCGSHFCDWFIDRTQNTIDRFKMFDRSDRLLVAVSGGKDSLTLWDAMLQLGYRADGLYIGLGIDGGSGYSDESLAAVRRFVEQRPQLLLHVVDLESAAGQGVPGLARQSLRGQGKPCSVCGLSKRYVMNRVAVDGNYDALATGHNLDDEAAILMQNTLHWQTGYLARQEPVLAANHEGLARKVKPLVRFYEREVAAYALLRGIDYQYEECPHAAGAKTLFYKEWLNRLESESPGAKYQFYNLFLRARKRGEVSFADEAKLELAPCGVCGQPTTAGERCAFCRLWNRENPLPLFNR